MKYLIILSFLLLSTFSNAKSITRTPLSIEQEIFYQELGLENKISREVFQKSLNKHNQTKDRSNIITIIDYSKPSNVKRLAIIDLKDKRLLFNEYVSHGRKSGFLRPTKFSNKINSHKTSLGQYKTSETYYGKHGYSLKLDGKENSNTNARDRYIVLHGADYVSDNFVKQNGYAGRSLGCPAVDRKVSKKIIDLIKNGTYIYAYI